MHPCNSLKKIVPCLIFYTCIIACRHEKDQLANYVDPADNFSIPNHAMVKDEQGKKIKLADCLVSDSVFVIRVRTDQPEESKVYVPEKPVEPGAKCRIRIYYRTRSKGKFRNEIELYTNTDRRPLTFTISGTAVEASGNKGISWLEPLGASKNIGFKTYRRF